MGSQLDRPAPAIPPTVRPEDDPDEFRAFARVVQRALLLIVRYLERRYSL